MKSSWRSGALNEFEKNRYIVTMKTEFPKVYNSLVIKRNNNWMGKIPAVIDDSSPAFILVGSMHLSGEAGLLNQLKVQGFDVEPFRPNKNF